MIPRSGRRLNVNLNAEYHAGGKNGEVPTVTVAGMRVSAFLDNDGILRVSADWDASDLAGCVTRYSDGTPHMVVTVHGDPVFEH